MYKNILIATDGSKLASEGVSHGLDLAKSLNVPVTVVTTTDTWNTVAMANQMEATGNLPIQHYEDSMAKSAAKILSHVEGEAKKRGVTCETIHVADRHPADGIIETASAKNADLIVMASHGHRGVKQVLLGSVASEVLHSSKTPVLIVR